MPASLIENLLQQYYPGITNVTDNIKLHIYILTFREMKKILATRKPRDIAHESLVDFEDALQVISCDFYDLSYTTIGKSYWLEQNVVPCIDEAQSYLSYVLVKDVKDPDYFKYVIQFRNVIFKICSYFKDYEE